MNGTRGTVGHRLIARALKIPVGPTPYVIDRAVDVTMRDGVRLKADHYAPADGSNKGTILVRGPYGRDGLSEVFYAMPFVTRGYHVVMQNCRGTFGSEGVAFAPAVGERNDAYDTVQWLREQSWYGGRFATLGGSYVGFTQWVLMQDAPEDLAAAVVMVGPDDISQLAWRDGALRIADLMTWSEELAWQEDVGAVRGLVRSLRAQKRRAPVLNDLSPSVAAQTLLKGRSPWFAEYSQHPDLDDEYWASHRVTEVLTDLRVPVLLSAGWQDVILTENLEQLATLTEQGSPVALTVGPWKHGMDLAFKAAGTLVTEALEWFEEHLAGVPGTREAPVRVQLRGDSRWHSLPAWPPASEPLTLFAGEAGTLAAAAPTASAAATSFTYDPARPTPTTGGALLSPGGGYQDCRRIDARDDVVTFTGPVLAEDLVIGGTVEVNLAYACTSEDHDVFLRLSEVDAKGRSVHVTDRFVRRGTSDGQDLHVELAPTAYRFAQGSRIRFTVAGGAHPVYARPLDAEGAVLGGAHLEPRTYSISHNSSQTSTITLPVVSWDEDRS